MTYTIIEILDFVIDKTGCSENEIAEQSDLLNDLGCAGDDFDELLINYSKEFKVDIPPCLF